MVSIGINITFLDWTSIIQPTQEHETRGKEEKGRKQ